MLSLDDKRWESLKGSYQMPFDPRPAIAMLTPQTNLAKHGKNSGKIFIIKAISARHLMLPCLTSCESIVNRPK